MKIEFYGSDFSFPVGRAAFDGYPAFAVDSIILNNKNYGPGFCVRPDNPTRIYFNSTYGILKYVNEATKVQFIYTE